MRLVLLFTVIIGMVNCQMIIPHFHLGHVYNNGSHTAPVYIDVHNGPLCPDSADAFPTMKQVADYYGDLVKLTLHEFPLPFHSNAYLCAIGSQVVKKLASVEKTVEYIEEIYKHRGDLSNANTVQWNLNQVKDKLGDIAANIGIDKDDFISGLGERDMDIAVRTGWKYTCSRGIASTPTFLINDVIVAAESKWTLDDWRNLIDPLLEKNGIDPIDLLG